MTTCHKNKAPGNPFTWCQADNHAQSTGAPPERSKVTTRVYGSFNFLLHADQNPRHPDKDGSAQHCLLYQSQTSVNMYLLVRVA